MIEEEQERFETELRRVMAAALPAELTDRLREAKTSSPVISPPRRRRFSGSAGWFVWMRWAIAATPVVVAVIIFVRLQSRPNTGSGNAGTAAAAGIKANAIQVNHALVSSFDAVAELPGGEPVRFRCSQWMDEVVMSDDSRGMVIRQSSPRVEVVPVRFETY